MRSHAEIGASDQFDTVQQEGRSEGQALNQKISLVVSDGSYMTSELLARALTRIKALWLSLKRLMPLLISGQTSQSSVFILQTGRTKHWNCFTGFAICL